MTDELPLTGKMTAAGRVLAVLGAFSSGTGSLTLSEISRLAGLSLPTTHRLVREVQEWGGLEDDHGRYRLSAKFVALAAHSTRELPLRERALPFLAALHRRAGHTVHLAVRNGNDVMNIEVLRLHPNFGGENRIGGSLPLHVPAAGLVLLAHEDPEFVREYARQPLRRYTPHTIGDEATLQRTLESVRIDRYALMSETVIPGWATVAAPVTDDEGTVIAAVNVLCWLERDDPAAVVGMVTATAQRVSQAMRDRRAKPSPRTLEFQRRHLSAR